MQADSLWTSKVGWSGLRGVLQHCEQGMSRSRAIAAALCKRMGGDNRKLMEKYQPNMYVYALVLEDDGV